MVLFPPIMNTHPVKYLKDYRPAPFVVDRIDLKFDIFEDQTLVTSSMQIHKNTSVADESTPPGF